MSRERIQRWSLALIALIVLFTLPTAIQATFAPESWFDDFPLGRGWMAAAGGAYDEHLVRDVGLDTADQVGLVGSLTSIPVLAALSSWAGRRARAVE